MCMLVGCTLDSLSLKVRRSMLESLKCCPDSLGKELTLTQWLGSIAGNIGITVLSALLFYSSYVVAVVHWHLTLWAIVLGWSSCVIGITAVLYVYYVYIIDSGRGSDKDEGGRQKLIKRG